MAKAGLWARPLEPDDAQAWNRLVQKHGTVFDSARWTGMFGSGLKLIGLYDAGGTLRGGFSLFEERRLGLRVLRNPPFTRQVGPFFEPRSKNPAARVNEKRKVVETMAEYLDSRQTAVVSVGLSLGVNDCLPFRWRGYKAVVHYTYRIDLAQEEAALLPAMAEERRRSIRKAQKDDISIEESAETNAMRTLVLETFDRQGKALPTQKMGAIFAAFPPGNDAFCIIARKQGRPMAGVYVIHDHRTAYYLLGGYTDSAHHGAGALAMYHAILKAKEMKLSVFDFEGSVIQPIERYFRGFGGRLTPLFSVNKAWLPLEWGLKIIKREIF